MPKKDAEEKDDKEEKKDSKQSTNGAAPGYSRMLLSSAPGPGSYSLPSQFEKLSKKPHMYSFTGKGRRKVEGNEIPDPAKYSKVDVAKYEPRSPSYSFSGKYRHNVEKSDVGPGSYHKDLPFIGTKKGGLMTSRPRQLRSNDDSVGPGKYNIEDSVKQTWRSGPKWSHAGRPHRIVQADGVGPGRYFETKAEEWVKLPGPQQKDPGHSFTGKPRNGNEGGAPGPADYQKDIITPPKKNSWTMTGRHPQFDTTYLHSANSRLLHLRPVPPSPASARGPSSSQPLPTAPATAR